MKSIFKKIGKSVAGFVVGGGAAQGLQPEIMEGTADPFISAAIGLITAILIFIREWKKTKES